ncbi:phenylalanine--tRNA ligase subunit alpha [Tumebacillus algifaecis]|uniref:Phenylalanine--tRNA ligase alpha subunit n=1 Tax=Tumebacillus algifaecis TaxID=1214604 RepID=A0A223CZM3_9BACL|nr:phenylalanine--tRNA ligase subunit alpha [Tumebacillus algifaecis]ASS74593.1 phenylalanine--tRNA ligase subunit alpha [Tumebacillus algifaecis]
MKEQLVMLKEQALEKLKEQSTLQQLGDWKATYLGKKGELTAALRGMKDLSAEERPVIGAMVNEVREALEQALETKEEALRRAEREKRLREETIDVTLPGRALPLGSEHPLNRLIREAEEIFLGLGFQIAEGPEVETDYNNFGALNVPKNHPARDMQDTFYISEDMLLRTQTSPVQGRVLRANVEAAKQRGETSPQPVRIIAPGRVYRRDDDDATHSHVFMQIEGLVVDRNIRMSDLKGILTTFTQQIFGSDVSIRMRPSYFPFTEPSTEVDVTCYSCGGEGCRICKQTGWIEILGAGMVHPNVLEMAGYDPEEFTGFAFGMGVERIAMRRYGIEDIRHFYTNDVRLMSQFKSRV